MNIPGRIPYRGYEIEITEDAEQYIFRIFKGGVHQPDFNFAVSKVDTDDILTTQPFEDLEEILAEYIQTCKQEIDNRISAGL